MARVLNLDDPQETLVPLKTPCLVVPTEMGLVRHLTSDNHGDFPVFFSAGDFIGNRMQSCSSVPVHLGLGQRWTFLGPTAEFNCFDEGPGKQGIRVFQRNGACVSIGEKEYDELVQEFRPRGVVSLFSQVFPDASGRQAKLRIDAATNFAKCYKDALNFTSEFCQKHDQGLFMQFGNFTVSDQKKAEELVACRPASAPRMIYFDGHPEEVRRAVQMGFDLFVLRLPVQWAEKGFAMTFSFDPRDPLEDTHIDLKSPEMVRDNRPVVEGCDCLCCTKHTRSYLHHLLNVHEMLAETLLVMHNIRHYQRLFEVIRDEIQSK